MEPYSTLFFEVFDEVVKEESFHLDIGLIELEQTKHSFCTFHAIENEVRCIIIALLSIPLANYNKIPRNSVNSQQTNK